MDNLGAVQAFGGIIPTYAGQIFEGSKTPRIQEIVIQIDDCCITANINSQTIWAPRNLNIIADYMSKFGILLHCPTLGALPPGCRFWYSHC